MKIVNTRRPYRALALGLAVSCIAALFFLFASGSVSLAQRSASAPQLTPADYDQIYNLYAEYSYALDTGNGAARIAVFTPDGKFSSPITHHQWEGMDTVKKRTDAYGQRDRPGVMRHLMINIHLTPTTEGADGFCYLGTAEAGFYRDKLVKTANGWRFKSREVWYGKDDIPPTTKGTTE